MKNFYESDRQCWTDRKRSLPLNKKWTEHLAGAAAVSERSAIEFFIYSSRTGQEGKLALYYHYYFSASMCLRARTKEQGPTLSLPCYYLWV